MTDKCATPEVCPDHAHEHYAKTAPDGLDVVAYCNDKVLRGDVGDCSSTAAIKYWSNGDWVDKRRVEDQKHPLVTLASAQAAVAAAKLRQAPCLNQCEAQAFNIEIRGLKSAASEWHQRYTTACQEHHDKVARLGAEVEALESALRVAREALDEIDDHAPWGGTKDKYIAWMRGVAGKAIAAIDALGVK